MIPDLALKMMAMTAFVLDLVDLSCVAKVAADLLANLIPLVRARSSFWFSASP